MRFLLKTLVYLALFAGIGLVAYAYLGDMTPPAREIVIPVQIDAG